MKNSENIINCLHNCLNPDPKKRPSAQEIFASLIGKSSQELNSPAPSPTNKPNTVSESKVNTPTENETISADSHISFMFLCNRESMESISEIAINGQLLKAYDDPNHKFWNHENQFTLRPQNNFWQIIPNLKSENKTILNGKELEKNKLLRKGDVLGIGNLKKGILKDAIKVL